MTKNIKLGLFVLSILVVFILVYLIIFAYKQNCKIINGNIHIYKGQCLRAGYIPKNLVILPDRFNWLNVVQEVDERIEQPLEQMILDAEKDRMCLVVSSGYRSAEYQEKLVSTSDTSDFVAPANGSEHQTGLAVDLQACPTKDGKRDDSVQRLELAKPFKELPEYQWLVNNAGKYGFEQSFKSDNADITGYPEEDWHYKYIIR